MLPWLVLPEGWTLPYLLHLYITLLYLYNASLPVVPPEGWTLPYLLHLYITTALPLQCFPACCFTRGLTLPNLHHLYITLLYLYIIPLQCFPACCSTWGLNHTLPASPLQYNCFTFTLYLYNASMSCDWPEDQTPAYLFFFLCQLGLEEVNVGQGPLQTQVFVRDGGLQLRHLGFQLTLRRLLTEGNSSVNKRLCSHALVGWGCKMISGFYHTLWWDEGARWSDISIKTSAWSVWKEGGSFNFIPFPLFCSFCSGLQPSTTRTKALWEQWSEKLGIKAVTGRPFGLQQWDFVKKQNKNGENKNAKIKSWENGTSGKIVKAYQGRGIRGYRTIL